MARSSAPVSLALALAGATLSFAGCGGPSAPVPVETEDPPLRRNVDPPTPLPTATPTPEPATPTPAPTADAAASDAPASDAAGTPAAAPDAGATATATPSFPTTPASTGIPPVGSGGGGLFTVRFVEDVVPILQKRCASCHVPGGAGAGSLAMFDAAGTPQYQAIHDHIGAMVSSVEAQRMPPGGTVPSSELAMLRAWAGNGAPPEPTSTPTPIPGQPTPVPLPTATPVPTVQTVSFQNHVVPILENHCASCHSFGGTGSGQLLLFGATRQANPNLVRARIADIINAIEQGRMPPNVAPGTITADELNTLKLWSLSGTPNN